MKTIAQLILVILLVQSVFAQNWEKDILAIDEAYNRGDYISAANLNEKFEKKIRKKLGEENEYMVIYAYKAARNNLANGYLNSFVQHIDKSIEWSKNVYGSDSKKHANLLIDVSGLWIKFGNYTKAESYLTQAENILKSQGEISGDNKVAIDFNYAAIYSGKGFYTEAIDFIDSHLDYYQARAISKEAYIDEKSGKLKTRRLSEAEIFKRFGDYADLLNLKARTFWKQGSVNQADSAFERTRSWIVDQKELGKKSIPWVQNMLWQWQMFYEYGVKKSEARKNFEEALFKLKINHNESHYLALEIYTTLLEVYLANNDNARYKNLRSEYEKVINRYFKKSSLHNINLEVVAMTSRLDRERTKNLEAKTLDLLNNTNALPEYHPKRIELLDFLYTVSITDKNYVNAERYLNDMLEIKRVLYGDDAIEYHLGRLQLAGYYLSFTNKYEEANEIFEESFSKIVQPNIDIWHVAYVNILNNKAIYFEGADKYQQASEMLDEALRVTRTVYDNTDVNYAIELEKIARLQIKIGEYDKADKNIKVARALLFEERKNSQTVIFYVQALETSAKLKAIKGELGDAEDELIRSQRMYFRATNLMGYDELASNIDIADLHILFGRYSRTKVVLADALAQYENIYGKDSRKLIQPLVSMGHLSLTAGEFTEATNYAIRANEIAVKAFGENSSKNAPTLRLSAEIKAELGDYDEAQKNIVKAIEIQEKQFGREHIDVAKSLSELGIIKLYKNDDLKEIESIFNESRTIISSKLGETNPLYADVLTRLSEVYIFSERYTDAFEELNEALKIWELSVDRKKNVNKAEILVLKGDVFYFLKNYNQAEINYLEAKKLYDRFFNKNHPEYVKIISKLAKVYFMEGDSKRAKRNIDESLLNYSIFIKNYFPALSEREKARYWNTIKPVYEFYNTLALELMDEFPDMKKEMMNHALATKALLLNNSIKIRRRIQSSNDTLLISKYNEWQSKNESLIVAMSMSVDQLLENEIDVDRLTNELEELEREISQKSELFAKDMSDDEITWEQVKNALKPNEVAIEMVRFRYFNHVFTDSVLYAGLYVKNDGSMKAPGLILITNGKQLETRYFKYYRNIIYFKGKDQFSYENFWEPIVSKVGASSTIYLSADGIYNQINLEAIPTGDGKYVLDNSNIILVSNTKDIYLRSKRGAQVEASNKAIMFGNPTFYAAATDQRNITISQLPGTEKEVEELNRLLSKRGWNSEVYIEMDASEAKVKELDNPKVFHIATHGFFTPAIETEGKVPGQAGAAASQNPLLRTGLLLAGAGDLLNKTKYNYNMEDGILTAYEAMNLSLDNTDLVVLSACETGLGDLSVGEGVYGLQRAFMVAGAKTLIMSMFKVNDEATQKLMINFYQKWLDTGNMRQAFIDAKKELRNEFHEPIYWGAFIMIGLD